MNFPIVEMYRGVGIHDFQTEKRIVSVVKPSIDYLYQVSDDPDALFAYAAQVTNPAEARLFAADLYRSVNEQRAAVHGERVGRLQQLDAAVYGLGSMRWTDPGRYCSDLDPRVGNPQIEQRPAAERDRLLAAQEAASHREREIKPPDGR